jgi:hypothetical protein
MCGLEENFAVSIAVTVGAFFLQGFLSPHGIQE